MENKTTRDTQKNYKDAITQSKVRGGLRYAWQAL